tara:strand:- start:8667 stop:10274 length:1608 start_codon:yes stop_codon:yes gene_type:complete
MLFIKSNKSKFKKIFSLFNSISIILFSITQLACNPIHNNKRIIIASAGKIDSLDPAQANTLRALQVISGLGDPLYRLNSDGSLNPKIAKSLPRFSKDGMTIDIPLREDVFFHDGTSLNAEAMAFSIRRFMKIGTQNYVLGGRIKSLEVPEEFLLRIKLNRPSSSIKGLLTSFNLTPVSPSSYIKHHNKFLNNNFVGTGPYKLISFKPEKQRLEPFELYWGKKPKNQGIDYINLNNSTSLFGAIRSGEVDVLLSHSIEDGQRVALNKMSDKGIILETKGPAMEIGYITFNVNSKPLDKYLVRQALSYSLNRDLIAKRVSFNTRDSLRSIIPPILKKNKNNYWPEYNPKISRKILEKENYCNDKKAVISLTFRSNVPIDKLLAMTWQEQVRRDLSDCLEIKLNGVESTTIYKQLSEGIYQAVILDWTGAYPDPRAYLFPLLSCQKIIEDKCIHGEAVFSGSFWATPKIQKALEESEQLMGTERSIKLLEIEQYAASGGAYLPVWIVNPIAWAQLNINKPKFDGSGFLLLELLEKEIK